MKKILYTIGQRLRSVIVQVLYLLSLCFLLELVATADTNPHKTITKVTSFVVFVLILERCGSYAILLVNWIDRKIHGASK